MTWVDGICGALSVDLREAVMACLSGGESRRWTIAELVERFKNLGVCASRASVTAAPRASRESWPAFSGARVSFTLRTLISGIRKMPVTGARTTAVKNAAIPTTAKAAGRSAK